MQSRPLGTPNPSMNLTPLSQSSRHYSERSGRTFSFNPDVGLLEREEDHEDDEEGGAGEWQGPDSRPELSDAGPELSLPR